MSSLEHSGPEKHPRRLIGFIKNGTKEQNAKPKKLEYKGQQKDNKTHNIMKMVRSREHCSLSRVLSIVRELSVRLFVRSSGEPIIVHSFVVKHRYRPRACAQELVF